MPQKEIHEFFSDIEVQLKNKRKLHDDIQKLTTKAPMEEGSKNGLVTPPIAVNRRTYSKHQTLALKRWLMTHYHNPYPSKQEIAQMVVATNLTQKQVQQSHIIKFLRCSTGSSTQETRSRTKQKSERNLATSSSKGSCSSTRKKKPNSEPRSFPSSLIFE